MVREDVKKQIRMFKQFRELMAVGDFYKIKSPFDGTETAWAMISPDKKEALVGYYKVLVDVNGGFKRIKLFGLDKNLDYTVTKIGEKKLENIGGDELTNIGLFVGNVQGHGLPEGDYYTELYHIKNLL